jgi:hypothetical protein
LAGDVASIRLGRSRDGEWASAHRWAAACARGVAGPATETVGTINNAMAMHTVASATTRGGFLIAAG